MPDVFTPTKRSEVMSRIRGSDTKPELAVRSMLHGMGYRFRLHRRDLPGRPDVVLTRYRTVVFVHGCFWHRHAGCSYATTPSTRTAFWQAKFDANVERDRRQVRALRQDGWSVVTVWACELRHPERVARRLDRHLRKRAAELGIDPPAGRSD